MAFPRVLLKSAYGPIIYLFERRYPYVGKDERERILGLNAERLYWKQPR